MAKMSETLAAIIPANTRAEILLNLDRFLRDNIDNEEVFSIWLEEGVPDGTKAAEELLDISAGEFAEMWNLAENLLNKDY